MTGRRLNTGPPLPAMALASAAMTSEHDRTAELIDGPAAGTTRPIRLDEAHVPPATIDVELDDGEHVAYIYFGRPGEHDVAAYAYGWDRQDPDPEPVA